MCFEQLCHRTYIEASEEMQNCLLKCLISQHDKTMAESVPRVKLCFYCLESVWVQQPGGGLGWGSSVLLALSGSHRQKGQDRTGQPTLVAGLCSPELLQEPKSTAMGSAASACTST